jgi:chromosome segregation ATPase
MSEENQISMKDLDKMQELLTKSAEDIASKEAELKTANQKIAELKEIIGSEEENISTLNKELESFRKEKQDAFLSEHIELMKEAGKVNDETDMEALMEELRNVSEDSLKREAELLKELAEARKKAKELSEKTPARKTTLSKGNTNIDSKRKEIYKALGAEDLLEEESRSNEEEVDSFNE